MTEPRPLTRAEQYYAYTQSHQISQITGSIGHLRGDVDDNGNFHQEWFNHRSDLITPEFQEELQSVLDSLRQSSDQKPLIQTHESLNLYCYSHPETSFGNLSDYGFRIDTEEHSFLFRINTNREAYGLYCYCYQKKWLDHHMKAAERGIRFIDTDYKEKFRIPDRDPIRIISDNGEFTERTARYINEYHVEIGTSTSSIIYHIREFAQRMEQSNRTVIPMRSSLPDIAYVYLPTSNEIGMVRKGESGYYKTGIEPLSTAEENAALLDELNERSHANRAQVAAMSAGSMFGWGCPAADPKNYDENGKPLEKHRSQEMER